MKIQSLHDLWVDELKDLYNAEKQIIAALPKMAKAASSDDLQEAFEEHLEQTRGHVERLEKIFEIIDVEAKGKKCKGLEGIIAEGKEMMDMDLPESVGDAALIGAAQRVEHYEMAAYGTARAYAELLGQTEAARLLEETLEEEKQTDQRLTQLAEEINPEAERGDEDEDETEGAEEDTALAGAGGRRPNGRPKR
jgi:ferritin-like metal-binding protein YciE